MKSGQKRDPALASRADLGRFAFGENWLQYVESVDRRTVLHAEESLRKLLNVNTLEGLTFLDAGSGSGLFSLAARELGADVTSFDFDDNSVRATRQLKQRYYREEPGWSIQEGSVLDRVFLESLGTFDVVYSWGVLHHTGDMWSALDNVSTLVKPRGRLCVAIYNDQGRASDMWRVIKRLYNRVPSSLRFVVFWPAFVRLWGPTFVRDILRGKPNETWFAYAAERGMSPVIDVRDWVGGYPFEVARPSELISFFAQRGFQVTSSVLRDGIGCNEFAFERAASDTLDQRRA